MSGILAEFVEKIISLKDPTIIEVAGQQYANQEFARIKPHVDRPSMYEVTGLDSIVQLLPLWIRTATPPVEDEA